MSTPLWTDSEWTFDRIRAVYDACEEIAIGELGLDVYKNQIEIISSEQMLDAYTSVGMPIYYQHWSFGKAFTREWDQYKAGRSGLAYELVINSNPCINYLMEENTMTTQALVIAHAAFGHNHFFKNNYLFKTWTDADGIIDYLVFATIQDGEVWLIGTKTGHANQVTSTTVMANLLKRLGCTGTVIKLDGGGSYFIRLTAQQAAKLKVPAYIGTGENRRINTSLSY